MLKGKHVFITGANRGIGAAIARLCCKQGAAVYLASRDAKTLAPLADELSASGASVSTFTFDVSKPDQVKQAFQSLHKTKSPLDVLINNAGVLDDALLPMIAKQSIEDVYATNVHGALYCSQYAARMMQRRGGGSIINLSSIIGVNGNAGQAVYGGSKAAVIGMTRSLSKELADKNIRVNAIAPGFIDTDMARSLPEAKFQQRLDSIAMGRIGKAEDVANTALFLASDLSSYVTGQVIGVDGGMLI